ncbi:MAG: pyridoxal phosphate-dependent aminotransferase [Gammaproteobacteria bacterium]|nr:pyridoxal phosphate-dependent aminotransferase [Gammaproteobacteria bacterium]
MTATLANRAGKIAPFYVMELLNRAKQLEAAGRDIIHMEIGEPDFPTPQPVVDAALQQLNTGDIKYTPAAGLPELRQHIAGYYLQKYNVRVDKRRIFITPGASGAFLLALAASINPGDELIIADPCYPCNSNFMHLFDGAAKAIPVDAATNYQLTDERIKAHWQAQSKGVLIASPSNPTGTLIDADMLRRCIQAVDDLGGVFFSDEIYHGLVYDKDAATALVFSDKVFVINSFSKYFGMTGWRIGWLIAPDAYVETAEKLAQNIFIATPTLSQYAALAAFNDHTQAELERRKLEFSHRRDFLYQSLLRLGFDIPAKPEGAFYIYANCANFTEDSYRFAYALLEAEGVAVTPGIDFGSFKAKEYLRFAYTTSIDRMTEAIDRLERFIKKEEIHHANKFNVSARVKSKAGE